MTNEVHGHFMAVDFVLSAVLGFTPLQDSLN